MRKLFGLFFAVALASLGACTPAPTPQESPVTIKIQEETPPPNGTVAPSCPYPNKIDAFKETLSPSGATLFITNHTEDLYYYGEDFGLEEKIGDTWKKKEPIEELAFISIAYELLPNCTESRELGWEFGYDKLPPGTYRVVKNFINDTTGKSVEVYGEFELK